MSRLFSVSETIPSDYPMKEKEQPSIEFFQYKAGDSVQQTLLLTHIIVVTEGRIFLSYDHLFNQQINAGKMVLLPPGCHFMIRTEEQASIVVFRQKEPMQACLNMAEDVKDKRFFAHPDEVSSLDTKKQIGVFISLLKEHIEKGLQDESYLRLKNNELFFLMATYYSKQQLETFYQPLISPNAYFHHFVLENYRKVKTVKEFADRYRCSVSNFDKKFRQVFGVSAYQWMQEKKIKLLYHEINVTDKPLKQIAKEQKFLSLPQFNDYCKKHFGYPPGKMRKLAVVFQTEETFIQE